MRLPLKDLYTLKKFSNRVAHPSHRKALIRGYGDLDQYTRALKATQTTNKIIDEKHT
jgi:hypothetical protein